MSLSFANDQLYPRQIIKFKQQHPKEHKQIIANIFPETSYVRKKEEKKDEKKKKKVTDETNLAQNQKTESNTKSHNANAQLKSPPELLIAEAAKNNDLHEPAAVTPVRGGKISEEVLSERVLRLESPVEGLCSGMTSGLFGDLGIPSVGENTDNRYAISVTAGGEGVFFPLTFGCIAPNAFDEQNTMSLGRNRVEENSAFYEQLRGVLYAPVNMNDQNEYILMPDGESRMPRSNNDLFRQRLRLLLCSHNNSKWWARQDAIAEAKLEEFIVILCHMVDNDAWCTSINPSDISEINCLSRLVDSLWGRINRSLMILGGNNWCERAKHVENMLLSLVNRGH